MKDKLEKPMIFFSDRDLPKNISINNYFDEAIKELFFIDNPTVEKETPGVNEKLNIYIKNVEIKPVWIYYPWKNIIIKSVPEDIYFKLRTARNKNIISEEEQKKYRESTLGIIGMSIGSDTLSSIVYTGGSQNIKIADFDTIEITNLNRMYANLIDVGKNKAIIAAKRSWEIDPFIKLDTWTEMVDENNIDKFILDNPKLNILVDAMDTLDIKILSRIICRENKIPVIMATSNGDSVIIDIERFDLDQKLQLFHGLVGEINKDDVKSLSARQNYKNWLKLATKIVGPEYLTERMQESISSIGKELAGVPQLATTVNVAGSAISYVIRRVLNKQEMPSGRYVISLEKKFIPNYNDHNSIKKRLEKTQKFIKSFNKM